MMEGITLTDYEKAEAALRIEQGRASFYIHAAIYVLVKDRISDYETTPLLKTGFTERSRKM